MGNCTSCSRNGAWRPSLGPPMREVTLLVIGLDNAGKSTLLANLNGESSEGITPTVGFASTTMDVGRSTVTFYDLGGGVKIRDIWKNYYAKVYGIIFVVDASSADRLEEAKEGLQAVMRDERVAGKPLLVFANKQDKDGALGEREIKSGLEMDQIGGEERRVGDQIDEGRTEGGQREEGGNGNRQQTHVVQCTALTNASNPASDPAILGGVKWLLNEVGERWGEIEGRVRSDMEAQRAREAQQRKERAERIRRIREEREKQAALKGTEKEEEGAEEEVDQGNPFKPIQEVAREAKAREAATKSAAKSDPNALRQSHGGGQIITVAEVTDEDLTDYGTEGQAIQSPSRRGSAAGSHSPAPPTMSESRVSSRLSTSSDSLTDVTPPSPTRSSSSLRLHSPTPQTASLLPEAMSQVDSLSNGLHRARLEPLPTHKVEKEKRKHRKMLLSRLKNRNKTAPAPSPPPQHQTQSHDPQPPVAQNTWVSPTDALASTSTASGMSIATVSSRSSEALAGGPGRRLMTPDTMEGLPDLPKIQLSLPTFKVSKQQPGLGEKAFHIAQDITVPPSSLTLNQPPPKLETVNN